MSGQVKMPIEMLEEIKDGPKDGEKDLLFAWIQEDDIKKALLLDEDAIWFWSSKLLRKVTRRT
jgi:hypothetical protein